MTATRLSRVVCLASVVASCASAMAQTAITPEPVVTEARRREILQAADALTSETLLDVLRRAAAGDVEAQLLAGLALEGGNAVPKDIDAAVRWISAAADRGHPMAQNVMGNLLARGTGVPRDLPKAVEWYTKAAAQGYAQAQNNLGWTYLEGIGTAANPTEGARLFRLAAEQGNRDGQSSLAEAYYYGKGVDKNVREAVAWYRKAAEQGQPVAQANLAVAYETGKGVRKDEDEAAKWYKKSGDQGFAPASFHYGWRNLMKAPPGSLDPVGTEIAIEYFERSAEQGYPVAAFFLGELFTGRVAPYHVTKDNLVACTWYLVASGLDGQGEWESEQPRAIAAMRKDLPGRMAKVRKSLKPDQFAECERAAAEWMTAHRQPTEK